MLSLHWKVFSGTHGCVPYTCDGWIWMFGMTCNPIGTCSGQVWCYENVEFTLEWFGMLRFAIGLFEKARLINHLEMVSWMLGMLCSLVYDLFSSSQAY